MKPKQPSRLISHFIAVNEVLIPLKSLKCSRMFCLF